MAPCAQLRLYLASARQDDSVQAVEARDESVGVAGNMLVVLWQNVVQKRSLAFLQRFDKELRSG